MGVQDDEREPDGGVGVCVSGGGIRAAAFALGAVQGVQEQLGLMFGRHCADYRAAGSGGSDRAATSTRQATQVSEEDAERIPWPLLAVAAADAITFEDAAALMSPLATGSPEAAHIIQNGSNLFKGG